MPQLPQEPIFSANSSGTGEVPDDPWQQLATLKLENEKLKQENATLNAELNNYKIGQEVEGNLGGEPPAPEPEISDEALRKRLERICKKNSQGKLGHNYEISFVFY